MPSVPKARDTGVLDCLMSMEAAWLIPALSTEFARFLLASSTDCLKVDLFSLIASSLMLSTWGSVSLKFAIAASIELVLVMRLSHILSMLFRCVWISTRYRAALSAKNLSL